MSIHAVVRIRTPKWANPFARRRVEERLIGDSPLSGTDWLIEYTPSAADAISVEGASISDRDRLAIEQAAFAALTAPHEHEEEGSDAAR